MKAIDKRTQAIPDGGDISAVALRPRKQEASVAEDDAVELLATDLQELESEDDDHLIPTIPPKARR